MAMTSKAEHDLDAALAALAREVGTVEPRPGAELTSGVLADAALTALAREAHAAAPRPGRELVARVLADAAAVAAENAARQPARSRNPGRGAGTRRGGLADWLFGWTAGAVVAMSLGSRDRHGRGAAVRQPAYPRQRQ